MGSDGSRGDLFHLLLFLFLSALMVLAGAHLLETVCASIGLTQAKPISSHSGTQVEGSSVSSFPDTILVSYRYFAAAVCLFLAYHCLALREWARRNLVRFLVFDLCIWVLWIFYSYIWSRTGSFIFPNLLVQVLVVFLEAGLLWTLTHPATLEHFGGDSKEGEFSLNER